MENIKNYFNDKEIFMVGALDSLGVPYTIDNKELKSFVELVAESLQKQGINLTYVNICSLGRNKTWELENIIKKDYTVEAYIKQNKLASEFVINRRRKDEDWKFPTNPEFLNKYYQIPEYSALNITSALKETNNPIFLYSCGGMNIRSYLKIKTEMTPKVALDIAKEVLLHAKKHIIQTKKDIDDSLSLISSLNPNMEIYVLGVYAMLDNQKLRDLVTPFVIWYNTELKKVLKNHPNAHYVDIRNVKDLVAVKDMHPTLEGQKYIAQQVLQTMNSVYEKKLGEPK